VHERERERERERENINMANILEPNKENGNYVCACARAIGGGDCINMANTLKDSEGLEMGVGLGKFHNFK